VPWAQAVRIEFISHLLNDTLARQPSLQTVSEGFAHHDRLVELGLWVQLHLLVHFLNRLLLDATPL